MAEFPPEVIPTHEGETVIELFDEHVDDFGRRRFTAHWLGWGPRAVGFDFGHRGQCFNTSVAEFTRSTMARDKTVRVVGPFPKPAPNSRRKSS